MIIAFIGLGNMGGGMAANLAKQHDVRAFDLSEAALVKAVAAGCVKAETVEDAVVGVDVVITMLPTGDHVRSVYTSVFGHSCVAARRRRLRGRSHSSI
jgi:3-hydroxyisobutyrate dehydrogenase